MPYTHIALTKHVTPAERKIFIHASMLLADVYTMCSSHPLKRTKAGACNFSAALVLVCVLDALANHIYGPSMAISKAAHGKGVKQLRFEKLIDDLLGPWPTNWPLSKQDFAEILYIEFRNPLAHEVGRDPHPNSIRKRPAGFSEPAVGVWGNVSPQRIGVVDVRRSWPAKWPIFELDARQVPTATGKASRYRLVVVALYWHVKDIVQRLAR